MVFKVTILKFEILKPHLSLGLGETSADSLSVKKLTYIKDTERRPLLQNYWEPVLTYDSDLYQQVNPD